MGCVGKILLLYSSSHCTMNNFVSHQQLCKLPLKINVVQFDAKINNVTAGYFIVLL